MAENQDIAFNVTVPSEGGKSLKDLKKDFNDIQKELANLKVGTKEYQHALERLGAVKDDIGDLRDTINALNPEGKVAAFAKVGSTIASGFAAAQGAAALFGAESEELQKTMLKVQAAMALAEGIKGIAGAADAFKVLNAVMKSNPIFLIVGAIAAISAALYALKDKIGFIGDAFKLVGDVIGWAIDKITEFTDWVGISNSALTKQGDLLTESINKSTDALKQQTQQYDDQIAIAKASGKSTIDLEIAKQRAIIETNKALVEQTIAYIQQGGELDKERAKLVTGQIESIKRANVAIEVIEATAQKESLEKYKTHLKDKENEEKKYSDAALIEYNKRADRENALIDAQEAKEKASRLARLDYEKQLNAIKEESDAESYRKKQQVLVDEEKSIMDSEAKKVEGYKQTQSQQLELTKKTTEAAQALTDLYFAHQLRKNKGNAAAELEIRKKQFKVNKAFGIVNAVVDGVGAVQKALNNPYPLNLILAVLSGVLAAANVAKIASSKFEGGDSSASAGDVGSAGTASAPAIPQPNNTATTISDDGKVTPKDPGPQKVFIVETEIKDSNKRVANIEETAKI